MKRGFTLLELVIIIAFIAIIMFLGLQGSPSPHLVYKKKAESDLRQLHTLLSVYEGQHGTLPSVQATNMPKSARTGVRDLFPLSCQYSTNKNVFLDLLRPPGMRLVPFSAHPTIDEFDNNHIGYRYNSSLLHLAGTNVPVMWEPVALRNGMPVMPSINVFNDGVHVLLTGGTVKWIRADEGGWLPTNGISETNWRMMGE